MNKFLASCLCFLGFCAVRPAAQNPVFEKIGIENGLSQGMIFDILQTRDGFLWVATKDGLNRYDGYNFKVFSNNPFDPFSIAENTATALFEDSRGWLWVGLDTKGLDVYEPGSGRFHHFPVPGTNSKTPFGAKVHSIAEAPDGSIWFGQLGGSLWRIAVPGDWQKGLPASTPAPAAPTPIPLSIKLNLDNLLASEMLLDILRLSSGEMLVSTSSHQFLFDAQTLSSRLFHESLLAAPVPDYRLTLWAAQDEATGGDTWFHRVIGNDRGIEFCRIRQGQTTAFSLAKKSSTKLQWACMARGKHGHCWVSINNKVWDLAPGEDLDLNKPDATFDQIVNSFETDSKGNIWVGTLGYGLRKYNPQKNNFRAGAAGSSLSNLWEVQGHYFAKQLYWIFGYDPQTGRLTDKHVFDYDDLDFRQVNLAIEPSGAIWLLGCYPEESTAWLYRYPPGNYSKADKKLPFNAQLNINDPMLRARNGQIWVVAENGRLVRFDPTTEQFAYFEFGQLFGEQINALRAVAIAEGADGVLWIGTQLGLVKAVPNAQGFDFQLITADPTNPNGLNCNSIACVLPMPDGQIWLGTKGGGINILEAKTGKVRHVMTADGLLNNVVYGILPGSRAGEFWCSTNRGLAKIVEPKDAGGKFTITTFTASLGLQNDEFNTYSFFKTEAGELLFGGINGLNRFFPDELRPDTTPPPVFIVNIEINHQKSAVACPENLQKLEISHDQNNLSFEFAALDFTDPSKNRYRYQLVGLDETWVETGNHRFAHFSHLAPGKYELRVQGSNGESDWREAQTLVVVVHPPWWRSDLAYLCYFLLLVWAGWRGYQFQIQRIKEREQLAFEQRETERVKVLEQLKTNFFSNVTHEFRTPLTLILEPARQLRANPKDPDLPEKIGLIEQNSQQLLGLVNQLLDMAKVESGQMSLDLRRADLGETVRGVFERFLPLAEKRGVELTLKNVGKAAEMEFDFDPNKVELVLNNLISNALKFTPTGGTVAVALGNGELKPHPDKVVGTKLITVKDTGIGIAPENQGKIFDRFYQVDGSNTRTGEGTGIGLALSKELAEFMGGGLTVESELGKGATFTLSMPLKFEALTEQAASGGLTTFEKLSNPTPDLKTAGPAGEQPVVLVIEDNAELRTFIRKSIAGAGWQVIEAADGEEGVKLALEHLPDLVISDVMMPRKDGFAVVDELKNAELTAHIPVILLTAKSGIESRLAGLRRGADDYLTKPFSTEELVARMENLLENRRRLRAIFGKQAANLVAAPSSEQASAGEFLSPLDREFLQKFMLLLEENLDDERLGVEDFAKRMFISRVQLHRKLKAVADRSATDFIRDFRLDRAHALLKNREGRVGEVALRVGFGNEKYFSTAFKEKFGVSPSQV